MEVKEKTKLLQYLEANHIPLIEVFKETMLSANEDTISYQTVWNAAHGYYKPKHKTKRTIANALGVPLEEIFN